jgi:hypothetical protein
MPTFIVECYWPGITEERVRQALAFFRRAGNRASGGESVTPLGCILVPSDGVAIFLFEGSSSLRLTQIARHAELPFDRIVESIHIGVGGELRPPGQHLPGLSG